MRVQSFFSETRVDVLKDFMRRHPFATLVIQRDGAIDANHLPVLLADDGEYGAIHAHTSRALDLGAVAGQEVLVIFQGDHAYVSPSWYPSKRATGQAVPTWNYAVVHAYGTLRVIDDPAWIRKHLEAMTDTHEAGRPEPWKVSDAPEAYTNKMIGALVGVEIQITRLLGKFKLSQNRSPEDRTGVVTNLRAEQAPIARMMQQD